MQILLLLIRLKIRKITGQTDSNGTKNVEMLKSLKYLSNVWRTFEMPLINCVITLDLNWSKNCVIVASNADQETTFSITDAKLYFTTVTLATQDNTKLLEQSKSRLKEQLTGININKKNQQKDKANIKIT